MQQHYSLTVVIFYALIAFLLLDKCQPYSKLHRSLDIKYSLPQSAIEAILASSSPASLSEAHLDLVKNGLIIRFDPALSDCTDVVRGALQGAGLDRLQAMLDIEAISRGILTKTLGYFYDQVKVIAVDDGIADPPSAATSAAATSATDSMNWLSNADDELANAFKNRFTNSGIDSFFVEIDSKLLKFAEDVVAGNQEGFEAAYEVDGSFSSSSSTDLFESEYKLASLLLKSSKAVDFLFDFFTESLFELRYLFRKDNFYYADYFLKCLFSRPVLIDVLSQSNFSTTDSNIFEEVLNMLIELRRLRLRGDQAAIINIYLILKLTLSPEYPRNRNAVVDSDDDVLLLSQERLINLDRANIYKLRLISAIPLVPLANEQNLWHRSELLGDLNAFSSYLARSYSSRPSSLTINHLKSHLPAPLAFHMAHQGLNDLPFQSAFGTIFPLLVPNITFNYAAASQEGVISPPTSLSSSSASSPKLTPRTIRVGFLSAYFFDHSIGRIMMDTLASFQMATEALNEVSSHEPSTFNIEYKIYFLNENLPHKALSNVSNNNNNNTNETDDICLKMFHNLFGNKFVYLGNDDELIRSYLASERLDFLMFMDIGMAVTSYILAYSRLATYQAAWWGHPITTGISSFDFFFSLDSEVNDAAYHYSEQLIRFDFMNTVPYSRIVSPNLDEDRRKFLKKIQLPPDAKYLTILGRLFKLHPVFDDIIISILCKADDNATRIGGGGDDKKENPYYIVFVSERMYEVNEYIWIRIYEKLVAIGRGHLISKLRFVKYFQYIPLIQHTSGVLDTAPYGGCLTSHDALSNAVPIVTLPSKYVRGRYTMTMYLQMGYTELIANDGEQYASIAYSLLSDDEFRKRQSSNVEHFFFRNLHKNTNVVSQWIEFLSKLFT